MVNIFIIHGTEGYPEENWFPWLKEELEKIDCNVTIPHFPTPKNQTLKNWLNVLEKHKEKLNKDTIVIGHSLGVSFLLNVIEKKPVKCAFLIAGFIGKIGHEFDKNMATFAQKKFDWEKIKKNCKRFYILQSDNDPYVKLEKGEELAKNLDTDIILVKNAGHFNESAGYTKFNLLLKKIKGLL